MDRKTVITVIVTAALAFVTQYFVGRFTDTVEAGAEAQDMEVIETAISDAMTSYRNSQRVTINGETKTMAEAISLIATNQTVVITTVENLEKAVAALADD